ncbi:hypothetical protein LEMLEM_LOCUS27574, partial [Lemmus lemmus]
MTREHLTGTCHHDQRAPYRYMHHDQRAPYRYMPPGPGSTLQVHATMTSELLTGTCHHDQRAP